MDDWESSDESDEDEGDAGYVDAAARSTGHGSSQGHSSTSHVPRVSPNPSVSVSPSVSRDDLSVHTSGSHERFPVGHIPRPQAYFKDAKGDNALSSYDLYRLSRSAVASSSRVSSEAQSRGGLGEDKGPTKREGRTASMQRLDGLVLQHIEAERGTLSRIAKTVKDSKS